MSILRKFVAFLPGSATQAGAEVALETIGGSGLYPLNGGIVPLLKFLESRLLLSPKSSYVTDKVNDIVRAYIRFLNTYEQTDVGRDLDGLAPRYLEHIAKTIRSLAILQQHLMLLLPQEDGESELLNAVCSVLAEATHFHQQMYWNGGEWRDSTFKMQMPELTKCVSDICREKLGLKSAPDALGVLCDTLSWWFSKSVFDLILDQATRKTDVDLFAALCTNLLHFVAKEDECRLIEIGSNGTPYIYQFLEEKEVFKKTFLECIKSVTESASLSLHHSCEAEIAQLKEWVSRVSG